MGLRKRYRKRPNQLVTAAQLNLDTAGFTYRKWGAMQHCKPGDWLVDNAGEIYTVDAQSFARTYVQTSPGRYSKSGAVWEEVAAVAGAIPTKEGKTHYNPGDYLVFNDSDETDAYSVTAARFEALYEEIVG